MVNLPDIGDMLKILPSEYSTGDSNT